MQRIDPTIPQRPAAIHIPATTQPAPAAPDHQDPEPAPVPKPAVLQLQQVFQHVGGRQVLASISLTLHPGDGLLVIGPNGAGKTLLVRIVLGLDAPSAGHVRLFGEDFARLRGRRRARLRARIGAVLQGGALLDGLTVLENLLLPLRASRLDRAGMARAARLTMTQLQLDGMEHHQPRHLSLGQRRRVELARALIHRPDLLVWDGVADGLDPTAAQEIAAVLRQEQANRGLTIIATDNATLPPLREDGRVAVLAGGRLLFDGSRSALASAATTDLALRSVLAGQT